MIIKIMKSNRVDFWMCDNVESMHIDQVREHKNQEVADDSIHKVACSIFENDDSPKGSGRTWAIDFKVRGSEDRQVAIFNTMAYICSDNGKTIQGIC